MIIDGKLNKGLRIIYNEFPFKCFSLFIAAYTFGRIALWPILMVLATGYL